eukprot:CAMPEP_0194049854 /NCGR_PEP_ID=MMETSP0009_2-20130614/31416_1 /TAXON_ID=210454 /ORGANISM="Grammatophora oceanica, Strain CCMP 410" /LENGTH=91 /DNA_ID=CAMNT_0038696121 /DNA_START=192 /DNA_END=467 /DNA_ORIENTATION=-
MADDRNSIVAEEVQRPKNHTTLQTDVHQEDDDGLSIRRVNGFEETECDDESTDEGCGSYLSELLVLMGHPPQLPWTTTVNDTLHQRWRALS